MDGIPPTLPSDTEDVVWALQTAESLWKRGERVDAIVWLRRAAQAAGESQDDVRAAMLARNAAELSDWIASHTMHGESIEPAETKIDSDVDELLSLPPPAPASEEIALSSSHVEMISSQDFEAGLRAPSKRPVSLRPGSRKDSTPSESGVMLLDVDDVQLLDGPDAAPLVDAHESNAPSGIPPVSKAGTSGVPSAAEAHAGMLDPWAESDLKKNASPPKGRPSRPTFEDEEITTSTLPRKAQVPPSLGGVSVPTPPKAARVPPPNVGRKPAPALRARPQTDEAPTASYQKLPDRAPASEVETPISSTSMEVLEDLDAHVTAKPDARPTASPPSSRRFPPIPDPVSSRPFPLSKPPTRPSAAATPMPPPMSGAPTKPPPSEGIEQPPVSAVPPTRASNRPEVPSLGLESVEALGDLPDDAREAFEKAATIHTLSRDEEVARFALALVVEGEIDVSSEIVDAPAMKLAKGAILRSRGTLEHGVSMRLVCSSDKARVASWDDAAVSEAFRTCPWVEEDLRVVADRVQTRVGITMGPLGERLDMALREHLASRLEVKSLAPGEMIVTEGKSVPILLVAVGELELETKGEKSGVIRPGDFYFPTNVLAGGAAPATARAGKSGALVLFGEHRLATELMMTFPPLLEIFSGM